MPQTMPTAESVTSVLPEEAHRQLVEAALDEARGEWDGALEQLRSVLPSAALNRVRLAHVVAGIADNHAPVMRALVDDPTVKSLRDVARNFNAARLATLVNPDQLTESPVPGQTQEERTAAFAARMRASLFDLEPTAVLQRMILDQELPIPDQAVRDGVVTFLDNQPAFSLRSTSVLHALQAHDAFEGIPTDRQSAVADQLKVLQRVQAISPTPEAVTALITSGDHSAFSVAQTPRDQFVHRMEGRLDATVAAATHHNAARVQVRNESALAALRQQIVGSGMAIIDGSLSRADRLAMVQQAAKSTGAPLDVEGLFGDLDFCECNDCLSVFSPAAYLVELLQYLRNNNLKPVDERAATWGRTSADTALDRLLWRRPDLADLKLTCENTNVVVPYVDLVNEVMESFVAHLGTYTNDSPAKIDVFDVGTETTGELQAQPQHVNYDAYCQLKNAVVPTALPYHQPIDRMRIWLRAMKTTRFDVLDRFRTPPPEADMTGLGADDLAELSDLYAELRQRAADAEYLGLTQEQYVILTRRAFASRRYLELSTGRSITDRQYRQRIGLRPVHDYFGCPTEQEMLDTDETAQRGLTFVKKQLLPRTGLTYADLAEVLKTRFINPTYPSGPALRIALAVAVAYRFLQSRVDTTTTDPTRRYAPVVDYLLTHPGIAPGLASLTGAPSGADVITLTDDDIARWVRCYFDRLGQLVVLDNGEQPRLPIAGDVYEYVDEDLVLVGTLAHDGRVVDPEGVVRATTDASGQVLRDADKTKMPDLEIYSSEGILVGETDQEGYLVRSGDGRARIAFLSPADSCDLDRVRLVHLNGAPVEVADFDRIHRFVRLWRALGWTIAETDQALSGLGTGDSPAESGVASNGPAVSPTWDDLVEDCGCGGLAEDDDSGGCPPVPPRAKITPTFLRELTYVKRILAATGLDVDPLLAFWDSIGTAGDTSPYARTFLRHNTLATDNVFRPDANGLVLVNAGKITDHLVGLQTALGLGAQDIAALTTELGLPDVLTLDTVSALYRHAVLARCLRLKIPELVRARTVFGDPFTDATTTWDFLENWRRMGDAGLSLRQLDFAVTGHDDLRRPLAPPLVSVLRLTKTLFDGLTAIDVQHPDLSPGDPSQATLELVRSQAGLLLDDATVDAVVGLIQGTSVHTTNAPPGLSVTIPAAMSTRVTYVEQPNATPPAAVLSVMGILDDDEQSLVRSLSPLPGWAAALERLAAQPRTLFDTTIAVLVPAGQATLRGVLLAPDDWSPAPGQPASPEPVNAPAKRLAFLRALLPELRKRLAHKFVVDTVSSASGVSADVGDVLLSEILTTSSAGDFALDALLTLEGTAEPLTGFHGYLLVPADGDYTFVAEGHDTAPAALTLDGQNVPFTVQQADPSNVWMTGPVVLRRGTLYPLDTHDVHQGQLKWHAAGRPTSAVPASALLAEHMTQGVGEVLLKVWRAAPLLTAFALDVDECRYFHEHRADFGGWDLNAITLAAWNRMVSYTRLKSRIRSNSQALLGLFRWASSPGGTASRLVDEIVTATAWDPAAVAALIGPAGFDVQVPAAFRNEIVVTRMAEALEVVDATRVEVPQLFDWADPSSRFRVSHARANAIQAAYRARFAQDDWEQAVEPLYDELRGNQRQALVAYLVAQPAVRDWGVVDADGLFEFFLIDVQMGTCRDTSRIKQAISSVQSFVQRCLLGLEADRGVPKDALDRTRWLWMQKYRVWEANRKVFVHPESYLKAELRDDKSIFFAELEAQLLQKDINPQTIAAALSSYVYSLDEVANPEPVGLFADDSTRIHMFARTRSAPHLFYYRIYDASTGYWQPWERVNVDIPSYDVGKGGATPANINGCFLVPVLVDGRLLIFFPQFNRKTEPAPRDADHQTFNQFGGLSVDAASSLMYWEIKLAFSEYRDGKWSTKRLSTDAVYSEKIAATEPPDMSGYVFVPRLGKDLHIDVYAPGKAHPVGGFLFAGHHLETAPATEWEHVPTLTFHYAASQHFNSLQARGTAAPDHLSSTPRFIRHSADLQFEDYTGKYGANVRADDPDVPALLGAIGAGGVSRIFDYYLKAPGVDDDVRYGGYSDEFVLYHELRTPCAIYAWEVGFHAPMLLAQRLLASKQFDDALDILQYIVNPAAKGTGEDPVWRFLPLRETQIDRDAQDVFLRLQPNTPDSAITAWRDDPFNPHVVARDRISAYKRWAAMQYVKLWIEYGDYYFRQNTLEAIPLAIQCYVVASHAFGPVPQEIPKRGRSEPATYRSLWDKWDAFSNAMVDLELAFPFSNQPIPETIGSAPPDLQPANLFGTASSLYFCIPANPEIRQLRATIDDRLGKIRACRDINGVYTPLPLFEAALDPNQLVAAAAAGLSIASVLNDLDAPMPNYRFTYLLQKALEACQELKALGAAFLSAKEKGDAEVLGHLRATHEQAIAALVMEVRTQQLEEANRAKQTLQASRASTVYRLQHQLRLIGEDLSRVPSGDADFTELPDLLEEPLPVSGLKLMALEKEELDKAARARDTQLTAGLVETLASILHALPTINVRGTPLGVGGGGDWGGTNLGNMTQAVARGIQVASAELSYQSSNAGRKASFQRQLQERVQAANVAGYEITNIDRQILAQDIRIDIAQKEIKNQQRMIDNSRDVLDYLESKYTGTELYTYLAGQLSQLHYQAYTLAYELAKKAEKLFRFERGISDPTFIQFGYWDPARDGLMAGERLHQGLKQLETAYQTTRGHDFEVTKSISLRRLDPASLLQLRETGSCEFSLSELLFDLDYPGHYQRRIKTVGITMACTVGSPPGLNATVRLVSNRFRRDSQAKNGSDYVESRDSADERFVSTSVPLTAVAVSSHDHDTGVFELNLHDERYLPFEGAGAISSWRLELPHVLRPFDYSTITDVTMRLRYTSLDGGDTLTQAAQASVADYVKSVDDLGRNEGLFTSFDVVNEFGDEWYAGMHPAASATERVVSLPDITRTLPYLTQRRSRDKVVATDVYLFVAGDLTPGKVTATQGGVDLAFTDDAPVGDLKVFAAHDVAAPVTDLTLTIADLTAPIDQFWVVERYTLL